MVVLFNLARLVIPNSLINAYDYKPFLSNNLLVILEMSKKEKIIIPDNWDILFFGILRMMAQKTEYENFHRMLNKKGYNNGLHSYFINYESSKKLLSLITTVGAINQIDILLRDNANQFQFFIYKDLLIKQDVDNLESTRLGRFVKDELKINFDEINIIS